MRVLVLSAAAQLACLAVGLPPGGVAAGGPADPQPAPAPRHPGHTARAWPRPARATRRPGSPRQAPPTPGPGLAGQAGPPPRAAATPLPRQPLTAPAR